MNPRFSPARLVLSSYLTFIVLSSACEKKSQTIEDPTVSEETPLVSSPDQGEISAPAADLCVGYLEGTEPLDLRACAIDADCVKVVEGCCPCNAGGQPVGINARYAACVRERNDRCEEGQMCAQVMLCTEEPARCVEGTCVVAAT